MVQKLYQPGYIDPDLACMASERNGKGRGMGFFGACAGVKFANVSAKE